MAGSWLDGEKWGKLAEQKQPKKRYADALKSERVNRECAFALSSEWCPREDSNLHDLAITSS
jgi:hypothetical protein